MHVKALGQAMQKRSETFHQQSGYWMYESLVIQKALVDHLGEDIITVQDFEIRREATSSIIERGVGDSQFIVAMEETGHHGELAVTVKNPHFGDDVPTLSDDIVEFIAKVVVQFCPKMSLTVWSEYRCDGVLFRGHPRFRSEQAWNDWAMIEWPTLVVGKDGESHIVNLDVVGQIYGFIDLQDPQRFDFDMFYNRLIPTLQEGRHTIYAIIHSLKRAAIATFPKSVVRKGEFEYCDSDRSRKLTLVDTKAISDVAFGVPNIGGHAKDFLFLAQQVTWADHFHP